MLKIPENNTREDKIVTNSINSHYAQRDNAEYLLGQYDDSCGNRRVSK